MDLGTERSARQRESGHPCEASSTGQNLGRRMQDGSAPPFQSGKHQRRPLANGNMHILDPNRGRQSFSLPNPNPKSKTRELRGNDVYTEAILGFSKVQVGERLISSVFPFFSFPSPFVPFCLYLLPVFVSLHANYPLPGLLGCIRTADMSPWLGYSPFIATYKLRCSFWGALASRLRASRGLQRCVCVIVYYPAEGWRGQGRGPQGGLIAPFASHYFCPFCSLSLSFLPRGASAGSFRGR
jgi:hypothetical protein